MEIRVKDVQNRPPVFQGSLAAVIDEDSAIGTLVMTIQAKDGDHGLPRKIVYDLLTSKIWELFPPQFMGASSSLSRFNKWLNSIFWHSDPSDYFLLDAKTGELRTARPLDREALPDATGLIVLSVRVN